MLYSPRFAINTTVSQLLQRQYAQGTLAISTIDLTKAAAEAQKPIVQKQMSYYLPKTKCCCWRFMMQGVAPLLKRQLQTDYNISSIL